MRSPTFRYTLPGFFLLSLILPLTDSQTLSSTASGYRISFCHHNSQAQQEKRKTQSDKEPTESQPPSPSPYDLASFIANNPEANLRNTWKQLGIKSVNFGFDDSDDEADHSYVDEFLNRCNDCDVETFSIELDGEQGREVLLRVSDRPSESCRYLLFKQLKHRSRKPEWKLLGHIDHGFGRYRMPQHDIAYGGRRKWLVIKVQGGSGSGFSLYYDRLFQVDSSGLKEVMRFPSEGHIASCCSHPVREFATRIINCDMTNNTVTVELEFSVSYSTYSDRDKILLWEKEQKAVYKKGINSKRVLLDNTKSDLTEEEIKAIYGGEGLSEENVIKYNYKELSEIAMGQENRRKEWLRQFLDQKEQSPEKASLRQLIKQ